MWCPACRADVAAELSLDSRHFRCARCSVELGTAAGAFGSVPNPAASTGDAERSARDLLARWNAQNPLVVKASVEAAKPASELMPPIVPQAAAVVSPKNEVQMPKKIRRIDRAESRGAAQSGLEIPRPHLPVEKPANWTATIGQMCAYFGIGLITCGTALVIWGYFGGPVKLAPTGWLVTTIGQMFLFLGVVTLISGGMEQTSTEVATRIEQLGARLMRIEAMQHQLSGPHRRRRSKSRRHEPRNSQQEAA